VDVRDILNPDRRPVAVHTDDDAFHIFDRLDIAQAPDHKLRLGHFDEPPPYVVVGTLDGPFHLR